MQFLNKQVENSARRSSAVRHNGEEPEVVAEDQLTGFLEKLYTAVLPTRARRQFPQSGSSVVLPASLVLLCEIQDEGWISTLLPSRN